MLAPRPTPMAPVGAPLAPVRARVSTSSLRTRKVLPLQLLWSLGRVTHRNGIAVCPRGSAVAYAQSNPKDEAQPGRQGDRKTGGQQKPKPSSGRTGSGSRSGRGNSSGRPQQRRRSAAPLLYLPTPPTSSQVQWLPQPCPEPDATARQQQQQVQPQQPQPVSDAAQRQQQQQQQRGSTSSSSREKTPGPRATTSSNSVIPSGIVVHKLSGRDPVPRNTSSISSSTNTSTSVGSQSTPAKQQRQRRQQQQQQPVKPAPAAQQAVPLDSKRAAPAVLVSSRAARRKGPAPLETQLAQLRAAENASLRNGRTPAVPGRQRGGERGSGRGHQVERQGSVAAVSPGDGAGDGGPGDEEEAGEDIPEEEAAAAALERQLIGHIQELARLRSQQQEQQQDERGAAGATGAAAFQAASAGGLNGSHREAAGALGSSSSSPGQTKSTRGAAAAAARRRAAVAQGELAEALLLRMYRPLVLSAAQKAAQGMRGAAIEEVLLEAQAALLDAARRFEAGRGADRVGPLAQLMMKKRMEALRKEYTAGAGLNSWLSLQLLSKLRSAQSKLEGAGRPATAEALAEEMGLSVQRVEGLMELAQQQLLQLGGVATNEEDSGRMEGGTSAVLLDSVVGDALAGDRQGVSQVSLTSSSEEGQEDHVGEDPLAAALEPLLEELEPRLAFALRLRLGLDLRSHSFPGATGAAAAEEGVGVLHGGVNGSGGGMTAREVAARLGVSRQRGEQLVAKAVAQLRARLDAAAGGSVELKALLDGVDARAGGGAAHVA